MLDINIYSLILVNNFDIVVDAENSKDKVKC